MKQKPEKWYEINKNGYVNPADRALEDRLSDEEIMKEWHWKYADTYEDALIEFARTILKKAREK